MSRLFLKISRDGDSTTSLGKKKKKKLFAIKLGSSVFGEERETTFKACSKRNLRKITKPLIRENDALESTSIELSDKTEKSSMQGN